MVNIQKYVSFLSFTLSSDGRFGVGHQKVPHNKQMYVRIFKNVLISSCLSIIIKIYYEFSYLLTLTIYLCAIFSWCPEGDLASVKAGMGQQNTFQRLFSGLLSYSVCMFCDREKVINRFYNHNTRNIILWCSNHQLLLGQRSQSLEGRIKKTKEALWQPYFINLHLCEEF